MAGTSINDAQALLRAKQKEINILKVRVRKARRQTDIFREKATKFQALYSQQQLVSERLMESIIMLRDARNLAHIEGDFPATLVM